MSVTGIIAEFNPLHNGHEYLIKQAKKSGDSVVCVLSSDFVQRGDTAIFPKEIRTRCALMCGVDLVIELPTLWSMSGAEKFALGAVSLLKETTVVDRLAFGAQNDDISTLNSISNFLNGDKYKSLIKNNLSDNKGFAQIREDIISKELKIDSSLLKDGNNNLAIEYIRACKNLNFNPNFFAIKRRATPHDSHFEKDGFSSASYIREYLLNGDFDSVSNLIPKKLLDIYKNSPISNISHIHNALLFKLRSLNEDTFKLLPDISEGLENRIYKAIRNASSFKELLETLKTKRYPLSRLRRLALYAALEINNQIYPNLPPYIRILGFNKSGEPLVKLISKSSNLPVIVNSKQSSKLSGEAKVVFESQCKFTDLYNLSLSEPIKCGSDIAYKTIKL